MGIQAHSYLRGDHSMRKILGVAVGVVSMVSATAGAAEQDEFLEQAAAAEASGKYDVAKTAYEHALDLNPAHTGAASGLTRVQLAMGLNNEALKTISDFVAINPFLIEARAFQADVFRKLGRFAEASKTLAVAEKLLPTSISVKEQRGMLNFDNRQYKESIPYFDDVLKATPTAQAVRLRRAQAFAAIGNHTDAIKDYLILGDANPANVRLQVALAEEYLSIKDSDKALEVLAYASTLDPRSLSTVEKTGDVLATQEKYNEAIAAYKKVTAVDPSQTAVGIKIVDLYLKTKRTTDAERELASVLKVDPRNEGASQRLVNIWLTEGKYGPAGNYLSKFSKANPAQVWASIEYANLLMKIGDFGQAEQVLQSQLGNVNPKNFQVALAVATLKANRGELEEALAVLGQAERSSPTEAKIKFNMGLLMDLLGHSDEAIEKYSGITPASELYTRARVNLSFIYEKRNQVAEALAVLKTIPAGELSPSIDSKIAQLQSLENGRDIASEKETQE